MQRELVLVVEGDLRVSQMAEQCLRAAGYGVRTLAPLEAIEQAETTSPALILISVSSSGGSGLSLCRRIRETPALADTPLLLLLAEATGEQRVQILESGADDCLISPFSPRELVVRVQAVLRRSTPILSLPSTDTADMVIDSWAMKLFIHGAEIPTTSLEFRLIDYLARHQGQVFTRDLLLDAVWGDMQFVTPRSVDACIRRIREKIEPDRKRPAFLKTIRGVGYRLDAIATWQAPSNEGCECVVCTTAMSASRPQYEGSTRRRRSPA